MFITDITKSCHSEKLNPLPLRIRLDVDLSRNFLSHSRKDSQCACKGFGLFHISSYLQTYVLSPWSTVFLKKLTGFQLVKKIPGFYWTRSFITAFTRPRQLSLSWVSSIQSISPHPTSWRSISILSFHLRLGLSSGLFLTVPSPPKQPRIGLSSLTYVLYAHPFHSSRFDHPNNIGWGVQIMKLLIMKFSPIPCHPIPLRPKYSPQYPTLKHRQPTILPECKRPNFAPIKNNRQNYNSLRCTLQIFG